MNISKIVKPEEVVKLEGEFNGEGYWLEFSGAALTPAFREALNKNTQEPLLLAKELSKRIKNWNFFLIREGDLAPTEENIANFPDGLVFNITDTVAQIWTGEKKQSQALQNGSAAAAS